MTRAILKFCWHKSEHANNLLFNVTHNDVYSTKNTLYIQYIYSQNRCSVLYIFLVCCPLLFTLFIFPRCPCYRWSETFYLADIFFHRLFTFKCYRFQFVSHSSSLSSSNYLSVFPLIVFPSKAFLKSFLDSNFSKSLKDRVLKPTLTLYFMKIRMAAPCLCGIQQSPAKAWLIPRSLKVFFRALIWAVDLAMTSSSWKQK